MYIPKKLILGALVTALTAAASGCVTKSPAPATTAAPLQTTAAPMTTAAPPQTTAAPTVQSTAAVPVNTVSPSKEQISPSKAPEKTAPAETVEASFSGIAAGYAEDLLTEGFPFEEFIADESEWQSQVLFRTEEPLRNFRFRELLMEDVDQEGHPVFLETDLFSMETLTPEIPLLVGMTFYGDMPSYGIAFTDPSGEDRTYAVSQSGFDGSVILVEY